MPVLRTGLRPLIPLFLMGVLSIFAGTISAQTPAPVPPSRDLEKRVRELEDTVRRLQAEQSHLAPSNDNQSNLSQEPSPSDRDANGNFSQIPSEKVGSNSEPYFLPGKGSGDRNFLAGWDDQRGFFLRSA